MIKNSNIQLFKKNTQKKTTKLEKLALNEKIVLQIKKPKEIDQKIK